MTPRILFVNHAGVLGGGELSLLDIARHYRDSSRVLLFRDGPFQSSLAEAGVCTEVLEAGRGIDNIKREGGLLADLRAVPGVAQLAREVARRAREYDVIYANSQKSMLVSAAAGQLSRRPVVWHLRDLMSADHFSLVHRIIAVQTANAFVNRVVANSHATRSAFISSGGRERKVHVVHNGIDPSRFSGAADSPVAGLRKELGLEGVPVVGVFSRLAAWKGQHVLLEALADLPGVHALFVGDAIFSVDRSYADSLHRMAESPSLRGRVHFLGFRRDVPELIRAVDVVAHTSVAPEPFGRVIVEGMLSYRPVVATQAGGASEIIEHERTGLLVPPGKTDMLRNALRRVLSDHSFSADLVRNAYSEAVEKFSLTRMLSQLSSHLAEVTSPGMFCGDGTV